MLEPEKVIRDEHGEWMHSELRKLFGSGETEREMVPQAECDAWLSEHNIEMYFTSMEDDLDDDHPAWIRHFEDGEPGCVGWSPSPPGPEWQLMSIHDTDDGPVVGWYRELRVPAFLATDI